ncbi:hypothetical protein LVY72_17960 [Arthrobacter sp. I2-34]|uniref:Lipoprotein n=1 Tax=Arthrobacter hankyongi TaxID=2904801 RepID=A0ABS9LAR8_9MICC|nr:hypothetical protein [Arthrobacter hankyongi]MCG2623783.1 hypothetical protein [Arthrobacter hankyongi]
MSRTHAILAVPAAIGTAIVLLTGCSSSPQENATQACTAAKAFAGAVKGFEDTLKPGATVGEIQAARDQVQKTREDLDKAAEQVAKDRTEAVNKATDEFNKAVDDIPNDATVSQAINSLREEAANVKAQLKNLTIDLKCPAS